MHSSLSLRVWPNQPRVCDVSVPSLVRPTACKLNLMYGCGLSQVTKLCDLGNEDCVTSVAWTQRGTHLAVGTNQGEVQIWEASRLKRVRTLKGQSFCPSVLHSLLRPYPPKGTSLRCQSGKWEHALPPFCL